MMPKTWGNYWDYFGQRLVDEVHLEPGSRVLDIGTGGGSTLYPAAKAVGTEGSVIGIELWDSMVDGVNAELARCSITNAEVRKIDGRHMPFEDNTFDFAIAGFIGFDNYFDFEALVEKMPNTLIQEIMRVLRPGGTVGFSTWLTHEDTMFLYDLLASHWSESEKPFSFENKRGWRVITRNFGLQDVRLVEDSLNYEFPSFDEWWKEMVDCGWERRLEEAGKESATPKEELEEQIRNAAMKRAMATTGASISFRRDVLYIIGTKPS